MKIGCRARYKDIFYGAAVFSVSFLIGFLAYSELTPVEISNADTVQFNIDNAKDYTLAVSTLGNLSTNVKGSAYGEYGAVKDTVSVKTDSPKGYKLFIGMGSYGLTSNRLNKGGSTSATTFIPATNGTFSSPQPLALNSWGYAVDPEASGKKANNFRGDYDVSSITSSDLFAAVPQAGDEQMIQNITTNNHEDVTGSIDVYYGLYVTNAVPSGSYSNKVVYTALAETVDQAEEVISVMPSRLQYELGQEMLSVNIPVQSALTSDIEIFVDNKSCPIKNNTKRTGYIEVQCSTPKLEFNKKYDVRAVLHKFDIEYTAENAVEVNPIFAFGGITKMQDMTPEVCSSITAGSVSGVLEDTRDHQYYRVTKRGSKCWMESQLRYNLDTNIALTPEDSDVTRPWIPENNSLEPGSEFWDDTEINTARSRKSKPLNYAASAGSTYDNQLAYKIGTTYNFHAAIAGTELGIDEQASESICPKGWRIPVPSELEAVYLDKYGGMFYDGWPYYIAPDKTKTVGAIHVWTGTSTSSTEARMSYEGWTSINSFAMTHQLITSKASGAGIICIAR